MGSDAGRTNSARGQCVRLGVIGLGNIGQMHVDCLDGVEGAELTAVCDTNAEALADVETASGAKGFTDYHDLLSAAVCDAVLIAATPYHNPAIAADALGAGLHVLTEKPLAVHTQAAEKAIAAHRRAGGGQVFGIMFQQRTHPIWAKAKEIVESGTIGEIRRVSWIMTKWFRSQCYYDSGGWRGMWSGEGGGLLINQCPHTLDLLVWLTGLPCRVTADCALGKFHNIEVEDEVNALLQYPNGAVGQFSATTGEAPGTDRLEIAGDRGKLVVEDHAVSLWTRDDSIQDYASTTDEAFPKPEFQTERFVFDPPTSGHVELTQNFIDAVRGRAALLAPAEEALQSLALGNAMLMSGLQGRPVEIPFDDAEYAELIADLAERSTYKKTVRKVKKMDLADSFH